MAKLGFVLSVLYFSLASHAQAPPLPTVNLGYATYQGVSFQDNVSGDTNTQFLGIRYAAPPTGTLRFAAPQPPATTAGVQLADSQPNNCYSAGIGLATSSPYRATPLVSRRTDETLEARAPPVASEDCLFLNVFTPGTLGSKANLPVVVWIHGGGYVSGNAQIYNGTDLIRAAGGNVVVVVLQYRVGLFGFLPGQKVKDGGALNAGLLDQQFALKWVQEHIHKFGGSPWQVTIWGESAGAGSVVQHVVANGGHTSPPLFRAAIASSVYLPSQYDYNHRIPEMLYSQTVTQAGCTSATDTLACLRSADILTLQAANVAINRAGFRGTFVFVPVVDGTFITDRPSTLLKQWRQNGIALYTVTNSNEGVLFVDQAIADTSTAHYLSNLFPEFESTQVSAAIAAYSSLGLSGAALFNIIYQEAILICPTHYLMKAFPLTAFKAEFAISPAQHANDLKYYWNNGVTPPYANTAFNNAFTQNFQNFVRFINPNIKWDWSNITPFFPPWLGGFEMLFDKSATDAPIVQLKQTNSGLLTRCQFWATVTAQTNQ